MKKSKLLIGGLLAALPLMFTMSSCEKFLDRQPLTATLDDLNQGGVEGQIFGLYSSFRSDYGLVASLPYLALHNFRSDDSEKGSDPADGAEWSAPMDNFQYDRSFGGAISYWDDHYKLINGANTALQIADSLQLNDASSMRNIAEAKFFRAFAYYDLVRTFGSVPKIDFRIYEASQGIKPKAPVAEIWALIDADLAFASTYLPLNWVENLNNKYPGRLTSGAAKALLAKAHLFRGNWSQAAALCAQIRSSGEYGLNASYFGIFKDAGENSKESIWEIQSYVSPNGSENRGSVYATTQGVRASEASGWNLGWGWNTPTQSLVDAYEPGDPRKGSTILFSGQSDDPSTGGYGRVLPAFTGNGGPLPRKYWNKKIYADPAYRASTGMSSDPQWINQRMIRYADIVLMSAETANETGGALSPDSNAIKGYVNAVRGRVNMPAVNYVNQATMRAVIKHERRVEFGMEGERFFDLVRWNDAVTVLGPLGYTNRCRYYPVPQQAIDRSNGILTQNPEW